jgi:hypothetical protein
LGGGKPESLETLYLPKEELGWFDSDRTMQRIEVAAAICMPPNSLRVWRFCPKLIRPRLPRTAGIADFGFPVQENEFASAQSLPLSALQFK